MVHRLLHFKRGRGLLLLIFISIGTLQCGIPSNPYLYPPKYSKDATGGNTTFEFYNDTRTNILYLEGFEIYYKFYSDDTGDTSYTSDLTQIEALSDGQESQTLTTLQNLQFHRMYNKVNPENYTKPLLSIDAEDKNTEFLVTVDFSFLNSADKPNPVITFSGSSIEIGRYVTVDSSIEYYLESFLPANFQEETYSDIDSSLLSESFINIALVVFTYGVDESLSILHSLPLHLGRIRLST